MVSPGSRVPVAERNSTLRPLLQQALAWQLMWGCDLVAESNIICGIIPRYDATGREWWSFAPDAFLQEL
jgi:hypothetical protein